MISLRSYKARSDGIRNVNDTVVPVVSGFTGSDTISATCSVNISNIDWYREAIANGNRHFVRILHQCLYKQID